MSTALSFPSTAPAVLPHTSASVRLSLIERGVLALGIWEIPLQLDKYLLFRESDSELGAVAGLNISVTTFSLIALYAIWFLQSAIGRCRIQFRVVFGIPMLVYMSFVALSVLAANVRMLAIFDLVVLIQAYGLFFYVANRIRERSDVIFCNIVLTAMLLTQSFLVFGLAAMGPAAHGQRYDFGPLSLSVWVDGRVAGSLVSAVVCGCVLSFLWLPATSLVLAIQNRKLWLLSALASVSGLFAVVLTQTRGAMMTTGIGILIVGGGMLSRGWIHRWSIYAFLLCIALSAYPISRVVTERVFGDDNGSAESRKHLSLIALEMIEDKPLFGYGSGNCHLASQPYADQSIYRAEWFYTTHSKYLLTWVETGIFGLISYVFLLLNSLRYSFTAWLSNDRLIASLGLAIFAAILGTMVHMFVDIFNSRVQVQLLWVVIGIAAAAYRLTVMREPHSPLTDDGEIPR